jgi:hypothetical protein
MSPPEGLLDKRRVLALVTLFCLIETVWSWAEIARDSRHREDLITALFSLVLTFIAISIAYRSSFWADRVVFGALAGVGALIAVRAVSLPPTAMFAVDVAYAFMWTIAGVVSLIVLARGFRASRRNSSLQTKGRRET